MSCPRPVSQLLSPIYNGYIRTISGLLPSTPADAACAEAGLIPFRHRISIALCTKAAAFIAKTTGDDRIYLLEEACRVLRIAAGEDLPRWPRSTGMETSAGIRRAFILTAKFNPSFELAITLTDYENLSWSFLEANILTTSIDSQTDLSPTGESESEYPEMFRSVTVCHPSVLFFPPRQPRFL